MMMRHNHKAQAGLMSPAQNGSVRRRYRARVVRAVKNVKGRRRGVLRVLRVLQHDATLATCSII